MRRKTRCRSAAFATVPEPSSKPRLASVTAAAAGVEMPDDFRVSITNPSGKTAYPISSFTWLLIPEVIKDKQKLDVIIDFLHWMLGPGQKLTEAAGIRASPQSCCRQRREGDPQGPHLSLREM